MIRVGTWILLPTVLTACVDSSVAMRDIELRVAGMEATAFDGRDEWTIELDRARLAFGPVTLCPGRSAGEFCESARGEWIDAVVVDGLEPKAKRAGDLVGTSGPVLSWMYDYGLVSLLTHKAPYVTEAADDLGGNSVQLRGCAFKAERRVCFELSAPVSQTTETEQGVPVVRVSGIQGVSDLTQISSLTATFDPRDWVATIDFEALTLGQQCEAECDVGRLAADSQGVRAVQSALAGTARPQLSWKR